MKIISIQQRGSVMLESLIAILIFSLGILSLVALLGAAVRDTTSAKYRSEASYLANQVIGQMWTGDKSNAALLANYGTASGQPYQNWKDKVLQTLPGITDADADAVPPASGANLPSIAVAADNTVTVTVFWQAPGESGTPHNYVAITRIHN
jgi:type IV pilus assembly protein PilV